MAENGRKRVFVSCCLFFGLLLPGWYSYPWLALGAFCALFSLSVEIWEAIDKAASELGISSERYTAELVQRLAKDITAGLIQARTGKA